MLLSVTRPRAWGQAFCRHAAGGLPYLVFDECQVDDWDVRPSRFNSYVAVDKDGQRAERGPVRVAEPERGIDARCADEGVSKRCRKLHTCRY